MCAKASVCDWLTLGAVAVGAGLAGYKLLAWRVSVLVEYIQATDCQVAPDCVDSYTVVQRKRAPVNAEQEKEQRMVCLCNRSVQHTCQAWRFSV